MPEKKCRVCGCTETHACMTDKGPCSWAYETRGGPVCSACIVELPPDPSRQMYPKDNLLIEKCCWNCFHIIGGIPWKGGEIFTCSQGRFDGEAGPTEVRAEDYHHWFAESGIKRPNKTVSEARHSCQNWKLHTRWQPKTM